MYFEQNIFLLLYKIYIENDLIFNKEVNFVRYLFEKFV